MMKWEYKVERIEVSLNAPNMIEKLLNQSGIEGWELVNSIPQYASSSNGENQLDDIWMESNSFIFKRQLKEEGENE